MVVENDEKPDLLLESLMFFTEHYHLSKSKETLCAGLPLVNGKLTPALFVRAAEKAGLSAKLIQRELLDISSLLYPVLLQLKDNQLAVLLQLDEEKNNATIYSPELKKTEEKSISDLISIYSGYAMLIQLNPSASMNGHEEKPTTQWFWQTLWRYRQYYMHVLIAAFLINVFTLVTPLFTLNVYDRVIPNNAITTLWVLFSGIVLIYIFDFLLRILRGYLIDFSGKKAVVSMESVLLEKVLGMRLECKPDSVGAFVSQFREFEFLKDFFGSATLVILIDLPFMLIFLLAIGYIGNYLILVPLFMIPVLLLIILFAHKPTQHYVKQWASVLAKRNGLLVESLTGLETIKSTRAEGLIQRDWEQLVGWGGRINIQSRLISSIVTNTMQIAQQLMTILMVVVGVYLINSKNLTMGGLIACTILGGRIVTPFNQFINIMLRFEQARDSLNNLSKVMVTPSERPENKNYLLLESIKQNVKLEKINFYYAKRVQSALNNISCHIAIGEKIGLIGRTGSGKTTLLKLLAGFYTPQEGQLYIDNIDYTQFDPGDFRKHINYLPQESILFSGTVRKNILYGKPTAKIDEIIHAAKLSGVEAFIQKHPMGYDMPVGERGEGLSGGQRQAVAIARMILMNPALLLWDEPSSAMDEQTEREWIQHMSTFIENKTLIVASHKLSLLALVNRIIVMDGGKIVLDGPRDKVLAELHQHQLQPHASTHTNSTSKWS